MKTKIIALFSTMLFILSGCSDFLDRNSLTKIDNEDYWNNEDEVNFYANSFYPYFFVGYGTGGDVYTVKQGYSFSDDMFTSGANQPDFTRSVPLSGVESTSASIEWNSLYTGPNWNYYWIRKANIMLDNIEAKMTKILTEEQYNHWTSIGRFFRAMEYARLVNVYGSVPYYDTEVLSSDKKALYKDRSSRDEVMDAVYDDFVFAMTNTRLNAGAQKVNRYVVAAYVSRWALIEGSWQKYHYANNSRAEKFFNLAVEAANMVINSGNYAIDTDFHTLFGSKAAPGRESILYRSYNTELGITHNVASHNTPEESTTQVPTLALIKAFNCIDGKSWEDSDITNADDFNLSEMVKTRDPRFEATFYNKPHNSAKGSLLVINKFIGREALNYLNTPGAKPEPEYIGLKNTTGYPVMRYAEVLLNWIEAKAELGSVEQADIETSINALRNRPLDEVAKANGAQKTKKMVLSEITENFDSNRDKDVAPLLWEIRKERRMELAFEHSRIVDLRRWKKLEYMDTDKNPDLMRGTWANLPVDVPNDLAATATSLNDFQVTDMDGNTTVYNGGNDSEMVGFFSLKKTRGRLPFLNTFGMNPYLAPISEAMMKKYHDNGYTLTQTEGWPKSPYQ